VIKEPLHWLDEYMTHRLGRAGGQGAPSNAGERRWTIGTWAYAPQVLIVTKILMKSPDADTVLGLAVELPLLPGARVL
jgi:hypothetical protein